MSLNVLFAALLGRPFTLHGADHYESGPPDRRGCTSNLTALAVGCTLNLVKKQSDLGLHQSLANMV